MAPVRSTPTSRPHTAAARNYFNAHRALIDPMIQIRKTVLATQNHELRMWTHRNIDASFNAIWCMRGTAYAKRQEALQLRCRLVIAAKAGLAGTDVYRVLRKNAVTANVRVQRTWTAAEALTSLHLQSWKLDLVRAMALRTPLLVTAADPHAREAGVVMGGLMPGTAQSPEANTFPPMVSNTDQFGTMPITSDLEPCGPTPETSQGKCKAVDCFLDAVKTIYINAEDVDDDEDPMKVPRPLAQPASALFDLTPATSATGQKVVRKVIAVQISVHKYSKVVKDHTCNEAQTEAERPTSQQSVPRIGFLAFADQNGLQRSPGAAKQGKDEDEWTQFVPQ